MSFGIQDDGSFDRKHVDEIVEDLETKLKQEAGEDVDLRQGSPLKQVVDMLAIELARQWEAEEDNYYASYYEDAFGIQLDGLLALAGISRLPRRGATGEVKFTTESANSSDVTIPSGTKVTTSSTETKPAIPFETTEPATLNAGDLEVKNISVKALSPTDADVGEEWLGEETNVSSNTVTVITNPISGIGGVTNPTKMGDTTLNYVYGRDKETDAELKLRYENSLSQSGSATLDAIRSSVYNAHPDVENVDMSENTSTQDNTGSGGLPPKSFRVTAYYTGTHDDDIAQAILDARPAGIESYGSRSGTANTDDGDVYTEHFDDSDELTVYADINVTTMDTFPDNGAQLIKDEITKYVGGQTSSGTDYPGTQIGDDVIYDQVFAAIMRVDGVLETDLSIGTADDPTGTANIVVSETEVARTNDTALDVTVSY